MINEVIAIIELVKSKINKLFLSTCTFQDISIPNGWADEYLSIAERFDKLYYTMVKENK